MSPSSQQEASSGPVEDGRQSGIRPPAADHRNRIYCDDKEDGEKLQLQEGQLEPPTVRLRRSHPGERIQEVQRRHPGSCQHCNTVMRSGEKLQTLVEQKEGHTTESASGDGMTT